MECLAHVGQEEAVLRPAFDAQGKRAAYEEAVLVGVAQSQLSLSCQVYALEGASFYLFLVKVQHTCHFPVIFDLCVVFAHSFVASYRKFKCFLMILSRLLSAKTYWFSCKESDISSITF